MKRLKNMTTMGICALAISTVQAESIAINNPSFENGWSDWIDEDPSAISGESYEGNKSAKIEGTGSGFSQDIAVENNMNYVLKAWVKGKGYIGATFGQKTESLEMDSSTWEQGAVRFNSGSNDTITVFGRYSTGTGRFDAFTLESLN